MIRNNGDYVDTTISYEPCGVRIAWYCYQTRKPPEGLRAGEGDILAKAKEMARAESKD